MSSASFDPGNGCGLPLHSSISARINPFIDGNKRAGANAAITFLLVNDWDLEFGSDELVEVVLDVASGKLGKPELTQIFETRCRRAH